MIVKNGKKEEFAISAGSIAWWYDERLSRFVAFQQTHREGKTKQKRKGRIFPLTSLYLGPPLVATVYSFYFVREITVRRWNCVEKVLICGSRCSRFRPTRYRPAFVWISLNFSPRDGEISLMKKSFNNEQYQKIHLIIFNLIFFITLLRNYHSLNFRS